MSNILHLLNVADLALIAAGVGATLLMMIVGIDDDAQAERREPRERRRRRGPR
jgi:hypothetical protein